MVGLDLVETHVRGKTLARNNDGLILLEAQQPKKALGCLEIAHADGNVIKMLDYHGVIIRASKAFTRCRCCSDSQPAAHLIRGDERAVYGDKAYASQGLRDRLADADITDGLMYKAARNKPLKPWQSWFNKAVAAIRAAVERRFGIMKRGYGFRRVRYIGLVRNACHLQLLCTAINLKRALALAG